MEEKIVLQPFDRILSGYEKLTEVSVSVSDCSHLCQKYKSFGVQGYRLGDYKGPSYLNRYLNCTIARAPMLIYRQNYLIPLVFRSSPESKRLFDEPNRMEGFFYLLEWLLETQPQKTIIDYRKKEVHGFQVVDSAYVAFRLSEILDGAGFPISRFQTLAEFIEWNRQYCLINNGKIGRHSKIFDPMNDQNCQELAIILKIIHLKYPETTFFI